jgi:hypothetical protein
MKASALIKRITGMGWLWKTVLIFALASVFLYLYTRGLSPVWAAVAIIFFRGFLRFIYKIACIIVAAALLFAIVSGLIF